MSDGRRAARTRRLAFRNRPWIVVAAACLLGGPWSLATAGDGAGPGSVVEAFVGAYNQRDVDAMMRLAHPDIRWMSVGGDAIATETSGADALRSAMVAHFSDARLTRSDLESIEASGQFVHTVERATWDGGAGYLSQCSLAVYELDSGLIRNVWYFPAHACDRPVDPEGR